MKYVWIFIAILLHWQVGEGQSICLNMIVKDETPVIERCLSSVKPLIDYWVIVDTGSSDGTQEMIKNFMKDIPGELHERPWKNFAHNRNEALDLAKDKADYLLFIDADEVFLYEKGFRFPELDKDFYYIKTSYNGTEYNRVQLINSHLNWRWVGVLHEALDSEEAKTSGIILGITDMPRSDGNRSQDPQKYHKDALILEEALREDPGNRRNLFYLAQSYKDGLEYDKSLQAYERRVAAGGWDEEVFWSLLQIAQIKEVLKAPYTEVESAFRNAYHYRPSRAEPLYYLASYQRRNGHYEEAFNTINEGLKIKKPQDLLFVQQWIYEYGLLLEYSVAAYWVENYFDAQVASDLLLVQPNLPEQIRERVVSNLGWVDYKIKESSRGL